ncbi:guanylate kinase [Campylobacter hyointestinalis]|uniref:Guanylate kinase n=1 Tax=Campylobacter hyointestinalis subsp. hyointestinalis TaxID=91352 RepID=A0A855MZZ9_CAMHY|nr:guanylate kinase [Campylobacter hyointestinalis]KEA44457.1 guanylate kinase [Campylobacter hyointestinalis subsp. hyointestinalis]MBT0612000.1 guanylate kinase [Campylobacter hyointestinalis subsp. hyointestinalis]MDL2347227.1 guanylate kinase [Campylobacter hyointestinalis]MDL2348969.1 guanylate kinase [Campylobacter hyointestinalis]MDL2350695.1 guanylate kinase [Campylobacter hyointestinalis]
MSGQILILSGPSGSGKSTLLSKLMKEFDGIYFSISSTTRSIREGEIAGVSYHYISEDEFKRGIDEGKFLEWAQVHKNYYGTSLEPVEAALKAGKIVIFDIDVQGFHLAQKKYGEIITSVFVTTKNRDELKKRLKLRGTDSDEVIENRLFNAATEMAHISEYDYLIINENLEKSYLDLRAIFSSLLVKVENYAVNQVIDDWCNK